MQNGHATNAFCMSEFCMSILHVYLHGELNTREISSYEGHAEFKGYTPAYARTAGTENEKEPTPSMLCRRSAAPE